MGHLLLFVCLSFCLIKLCFAGSHTLAEKVEERKKVWEDIEKISKESREDMLVLLVDMVADRNLDLRDAQHCQENLAQEKMKKQFHLRISGVILDREILTQYRNRYLQPLSEFPLDNRASIENAYWNFFDPQFRKPKFIRKEANQLDKVLKDNAITHGNFIKNQTEAHGKLSHFTHMYNLYCKQNLDSVECEILIHMAPVVNEEFKNILVYLETRI